MDKEKLRHFKHLLAQHREKHLDLMGDMRDVNFGEDGKYTSGELSNYDNHPADLGTETFFMEHNIGMETSQELTVRQIDHALEKISGGTYGYCERCRQEIGADRLEIIPHAQLCIECETEKEKEEIITKKNSTLRRPAEEQVLGAPFGRKYLNEREDDEFEGLDQLNDLMKYGSSSTPQDEGGYADYKEYYTNEVDHQGEVSDIENISNDEYKKQL